jgi:integrase
MHFSSKNYLEHRQKALHKAGLPYKKRYSTRHTFAAWSLAAGMSPNQLVVRMGHSSKKMVYEVYGSWVECLDEDREKSSNFSAKTFSAEKKGAL